MGKKSTFFLSPSSHLASIDEMTLHEDLRDPTTFLYATERRFLSSLVNSKWSFYNFTFHREHFSLSRATLERNIDKKRIKSTQKYYFSLRIYLPMPLSVTNLMNSAISSYRSACSDNLARDTYSAFWSSELIFFFFSLFGFLCFLNLFLSFLKLEKRKEANHQPPLAPTQKRDQSINANCA